MEEVVPGRRVVHGKKVEGGKNQKPGLDKREREVVAKEGKGRVYQRRKCVCEIAKGRIKPQESYILHTSLLRHIYITR